MSCCSTTTRVLPNGWLALSNGSGNIIVTPNRPNQSIQLTMLASGLIILSRVRRKAGDIVHFNVALLGAPGETLDFRNGSDTGEALLPVERFSDQQFTTDGEILTASFDFVYTGSAWKYQRSQSPA